MQAVSGPHGPVREGGRHRWGPQEVLAGGGIYLAGDGSTSGLAKD